MKLDLGHTTTSNDKAKSASGTKRRKRSSQTLTFVLFICLAFFFWVLQRLQGDVVQTLYIPLNTDSLSLKNQPLHTLPLHIELEVQDRGFEHLRYAIEGIPSIALRKLQTPEGETTIGLEKTELASALTHRLSPTALILRQSLQELSIRIKDRASKRVAIALERMPTAGSGLTTISVRLQPDSVKVYGDKHQLDTLKAIRLPNQYNDLKSSFQGSIPLKLPDGLYSSTHQVQLTIEVEELTEQSFTLPLIAQGVPEGYSLMPLPNMGTVVLTIPRSKYADLNAVDVELSVLYTPADEWEREQRASDRTLPVYLTKAPEWVKKYSIKPERVQFVLEKLNEE